MAGADRGKEAKTQDRMIYLCEQAGYGIYYDSSEDKLYGSYLTRQRTKPDDFLTQYLYFLQNPYRGFALLYLGLLTLPLMLLNDRVIGNLSVTGLYCRLGLLAGFSFLLVPAVEVLFLYLSGREIVDKQGIFWEMTDVTDKERQDILSRACADIKKCIAMLAVMAGFAVLFLLIGGIISWYVYFLFHLWAFFLFQGKFICRCLAVKKLRRSK